MLKAIKLYKIPIIFALLSVVFYFNFAYNLHRSDFLKLTTLYTALFFFTYLLIEKNKLNFWFLASLGIVFRLLFICAIPNLSQDFYRFLWDGRLVAQGMSPYILTPEMYFQNLELGFKISGAQKLIEGMGTLSAGHFSNYPPVNQLFFAIAAFLGGKSLLASVVILRAIIIFADFGILYFGKKILEKLNLFPNRIFWYFLNPFIIIELTGNLHFEGVMLFFFTVSIYFLFKDKWIWAAIFMGISISVKLIPLLFLPLFLKFLSNKDATTKNSFSGIESFNLMAILKVYCTVGFTVMLTFLPFFSSEFIRNFTSTIALWFQNFEFNASIYYLIRWIGFQIVGWNIIEIVGKILPVIVFLFVLGLSVFRKNREPKQLLTAMLFVISFYFLFSTTVHPWYLATPLLLSVFTKYKFPIVWSFAVVFSYSAYGENGFQENLWFVAMEYCMVIGFAIWENFLKGRINLENFSKKFNFISGKE
ncbi:mannosyltransferase [Aequorivita echinoideorum]|uniref:Mannosyltransferase n=1 Tax=Aequorivita echinoideorum TaxID=1549647 RepID=A0ABS5S0M4_9FLAO|nr:mannosyltransferase [Aequorivita echinoideorum]MBT0606763.1 mannosyltransferase [Aequorivita echinoideorum]